MTSLPGDIEMEMEDRPDTGREDMIERVARAIAALDHGFDAAFANKSEWIACRGMRGGKFIDVNALFKSDYLDAARVAIEAMREPTEVMVSPECGMWGGVYGDVEAAAIWRRMIDRALTPPSAGLPESNSHDR